MNDETIDADPDGLSSTPGPPLEARVNEALEGLETVPVTDHVERFEAVHAALADALCTIDRI